MARCFATLVQTLTQANTLLVLRELYLDLLKTENQLFGKLASAYLSPLTDMFDEVVVDDTLLRTNETLLAKTTKNYGIASMLGGSIHAFETELLDF